MSCACGTCEQCMTLICQECGTPTHIWTEYCIGSYNLPDGTKEPIILKLCNPCFDKKPRPTTPKAGRNDPCPCGKGKKFKKCCGRGA